jgi:hypothetical protein
MTTWLRQPPGESATVRMRAYPRASSVREVAQQRVCQHRSHGRVATLARVDSQCAEQPPMPWPWAHALPSAAVRARAAFLLPGSLRSCQRLDFALPPRPRPHRRSGGSPRGLRQRGEGHAA